MPAATRPPRLVFVHAPRGISDAGELLRGLAFEAAELGAEVSVAEDGFPAPTAGNGTGVVESAAPWRRKSPNESGDAAGGGHPIFVFSPRDSFSAGGGRAPSASQLRRSVAVCEAEPVGPLDVAYLHARRAGAALAVDHGGIALLRRHGVPAEHLPVGPSAAWQGEEVNRRIDVACLAARGFRNDRIVASFGPVLWRRRCFMLGSPDPTTALPAPTAAPRLPQGTERARLLATTRVVVLGLGQDSHHAEELRAVQAGQNGTVVVAAHGVPTGPLRPGEHMAVAEPRNLALVADALLRDEQRLTELAGAASEAVGSAPGLVEAAKRLLDLASGLSAAPRSRPRPSALIASGQASLSAVRDGIRERLRAPPNPRRVAQKRSALEKIADRRSAVNGSDPGAAVAVYETPSYADAAPRISVCVPLYEHADVIGRALQSVAGSDRGDLEVLIVDDASEGPAVEVAREFLEARPWLPARLHRRERNEGLGRGRTDMARVARGDLLFMLDADNEVYPTALGRLADALDDDPGAAFAYSVIEAHTDGRPRALLSSLPWDPMRLRLGNYIDAMSMIRRDALLGVGGYTGDIRLHGWEDFDLWCHFAELGLRGLLVPEILCRYTLSEGSMISITNLDSSEAWALLAELYPAVLGGAPMPIYPSPPPDEEL